MFRPPCICHNSFFFLKQSNDGPQIQGSGCFRGRVIMESVPRRYSLSVVFSALDWLLSSGFSYKMQMDGRTQWRGPCVDQHWYCNLDVGLCTDLNSVPLRSNFVKKEKRNLTWIEPTRVMMPRKKCSVYEYSGLLSGCKFVSDLPSRKELTLSVQGCVVQDWKS